jgi:hypothetical protein
MILNTNPVIFHWRISNTIHKDIYYHIRHHVKFDVHSDIARLLFTAVGRSVIQNVWEEIDTTGNLSMYM